MDMVIGIDSKKDSNSDGESKKPKRKAEIRIDLKRLMPAAGYGLVCMVLLVGLAAVYNFATDTAANSTHVSTATNAWGELVNAATLLAGLIIAIGLPFLWAKTGNLREFVKTIFFMTLFLIIALAISGFVFFPSSTSQSGGCGSNTNYYQCGSVVDN
jgi:magnesium-transporting ATPase (P-type)